MFSSLHKLLGIPEIKPEPEPPDTTEPIKDPEREFNNIFTTHLPITEAKQKAIFDNAFQVTPSDFLIDSEYTHTTDSADSQTQAKSLFQVGEQRIPEKLFSWYVQQGFIGYQACAFLAQNWLINRCCSMKGRDAIRNWFDLDFSDGVEIEPYVINAINQYDRRYKLKKNLEKADKFKNVFGISHVLFVVNSDDPQYYEKPFNPDGIMPNTYKGMVHVDPYWVTPLLTSEAVESPESQGFYDPTYWVISGRKYHRSHFVILRGPEVSDILKPSYLYGGLPLTQLIFERVYAAERTANEAPQLAMSKRLVIRYMEDLEKILLSPEKFEQAMISLANNRDNFGVLVESAENRIEQQDTSLSDLDTLMMTQYQIVAAECGIPSTKLLGTSPRGFQSTGEHEVKTYHEELETTQSDDLQPIINKHHVCLMRSKIAPEYLGGKPVELDIIWRPLAVLSKKEQAEASELKSRMLQNYQNTGAIDAYDIRDILISDEDSGLTGLEVVERPEELEELSDPEPYSGGGFFDSSDEQQARTETQDESETGIAYNIRKIKRHWFIYSQDNKEIEGPFSRKYRAEERIKQLKQSDSL